MPDERWTADEHFDPRTIRTRAEFGQALTTLRMGAGLTVRQVASRAGANGAHSTIGEWFAGRGLPSTSSRGLLIRVLSACGVGAAEIEGWLWAWQRLRRSPGPRPVGETPYPGLASFQPEDAAWFHGRGALTEQLIHRVTELADEGGGLQFVVGASGSGKSSLVRAGLIAALRAEEPDSSAWSVTLTEPGYQPTVTLAQQFASTRPAHRPVGRRLVVVDQFEEVFAARVSEDERQRFIQMIADLAARPGGAVVVVTLRADFYGHALRYLPLIPALLSGQLTVGPMTEDELRVAIVEPARKARVEVEDGFVELLLRTVLPRGATAAPEAGVLPLLSHALYATWQHGQGARLTIAGYLAVGGIAGAVAASAEQIYQGLSTEQRDLTRRLFLTLVQVNPDAADTRRRVGMAELREGFPRRHSAELEYVLGRYVEKRLLTADTDTVEISHEALITAWPSLREWLKADRDGLVIGQQLTAAAAAWRRENRDPGLLYRGNRLAAAQGWVAGRHHDLSPAAVEFLRASARHTRRRTRRLHQLVGVLTALSLLTFGLAGYAFQQRTAANAQRQEAVEERNQALSRLTAGRADRLRDSDVPLAMQLSLAAYRMAPTVEARSSLLDAYVTPAATRLPGFRTGAQAVAHKQRSAARRRWPGPVAATVAHRRPGLSGGGGRRTTARARRSGLLGRLQSGQLLSRRRQRGRCGVDLGHPGSRQTRPPRSAAGRHLDRLLRGLLPGRATDRRRQRRPEHPGVGHLRAGRGHPSTRRARTHRAGAVGGVRSGRHPARLRRRRQHRTAVGRGRAGATEAPGSGADRAHRGGDDGRLQPRRYDVGQR